MDRPARPTGRWGLARLRGAAFLFWDPTAWSAESGSQCPLCPPMAGAMHTRGGLPGLQSAATSWPRQAKAGGAVAPHGPLGREGHKGARPAAAALLCLTSLQSVKYI